MEVPNTPNGPNGMSRTVDLGIEAGDSSSRQRFVSVVNVAAFARRGSFFEKHFCDWSQWNHFSTNAIIETSSAFASHARTLMDRWRACWRAASFATHNDVDAVISHDPRVTYPVAMLLQRFGYRGKHIAFSFNYAALPGRAHCRLHARGFRHVDRFVVYSAMERDLYHQRFQIPIEKIDFIHWGVNSPSINPNNPPLETGDYICAIGGNSRDYETLATAMRDLPDIRLVLVARPHNVAGFTLPNNVALRTNIPSSDAINILANSRFMVLPLAGSVVPCGHVTLVNAMHLGKAFIATQSRGIDDYAVPEQNCRLIPAKDPKQMAAAIQDLWGQPKLCNWLGNQGRAFAETHCTEDRTKTYVKHLLQACCDR